MAQLHKVQQGDYISKIALQYGFRRYETIWNHDKNAPLRSKRKNPNVLFPGDMIYIPDKQSNDYGRATDQKHNFEVSSQTVALRVVLEDLYELPMANADCALRFGDQKPQMPSDGNGKLEQMIPAKTETVELMIKGDEVTPIANSVITLQVGHLDPVTEKSGQIERLRNLGYYDGLPDAPDDMFCMAVEEFQCEHDLSVDGVCGRDTESKLLEVHGC